MTDRQKRETGRRKQTKQNYYNDQGYRDSYYDSQGYEGNGRGYYEDQGYNGRRRGYCDERSYGDGGRGYYENQGYGGNAQGGYGSRDYGRDPRGNYRGQGYYEGPEYGREPGGYYGGSGGYYEETGKKKKSGKKKHRKLVFAIELIVLLVLALGLFAMAQLGRVDRVKLKDILVNSGIGQSGYRNIALFGVDSREGQLESGTNSDTIMVASINNRTGDIKLVSVYRDTYLDNTNGEYRKATECFSGGGAERSVNMLNKNLDLDIRDFVTVDFNAIIEVVDLLGGIELDITEEERQWLNGYLVETSQVTGVSYTTVDYAGTQTVSGIQAMAYCRIRYTEGWDYKRTERQRIVLEKIFEKAKAQGVTSLISMVNTMVDYISTSLSNTELITLATGISKYNIVDTTGFPFEKSTANISAGDCVVPVNLAANVTKLHEYLFGDSNYTPSQTVQEISNRIISDTGIQ